MRVPRRFARALRPRLKDCIFAIFSFYAICTHTNIDPRFPEFKQFNQPPTTVQPLDRDGFKKTPPFAIEGGSFFSRFTRESILE
ncbi:hypothetical protein BM613_06245 [Sulfoacidibacillus thermotolerans]|uniref:Uncharacterized protein n=2 Tax=Sulfoacidibacillus thermotolerans TaxID=1765684 RepID=A0A2U3D9N7_SULT2|nr:hypothetical protein BM613_06245 [Sulfoacidibacillus thermotolerans]